MFNLQTVNDMEGFDSTKGGFNGTILPKGSGGGGEGTDNYNDLNNKPKINGHTLSGNKTLEQLGAYEKPNSGIPSTDLAGGVQTILSKAKEFISTVIAEKTGYINIFENGNPLFWFEVTGGGFCVTGENLLDKNTFVFRRILNDSGVEITDGSSYFSRKIPVTPNMKIASNFIMQRVYLYDEYGVFKSRSSIINDYFYTIPGDVFFIQIQTFITEEAEVDTLIVNFGDTASEYSDFKVNTTGEVYEGINIVSFTNVTNELDAKLISHIALESSISKSDYKVPTSGAVARIISQFHGSALPIELTSSIVEIDRDIVDKCTNFDIPDGAYIVGQNVFDFTTRVLWKIKNNSGVETTDYVDNYFSQYIPCYGKKIKANFKIERLYLYDETKTFLRRTNAINIGDVYRIPSDAFFVQVQSKVANINDTMCVVFGEEYATYLPYEISQTIVPKNQNVSVYSDGVTPITCSLTILGLKGFIPEVKSYDIWEPETATDDYLCTPLGQSQQSIPALTDTLKYQGFLETYFDIYLGNYPNGYSVTREDLGLDSGAEAEGHYANPIYSYEFKPKYYNKTVLLSAGMNTCEASTYFGLAYFIKALMEHTEDGMQALYSSTRFIVIPVICPSGIAHDPLLYPNSNNVRINKNFEYYGSWERLKNDRGGTYPDSEVETKILKAWINKYAGSDFWLDCHSDTGSSEVMLHLGSIFCSDSTTATLLSGNKNAIIEFYRDKGYFGADDTPSLGFSAGNKETSIYPKTVYAKDVARIPSAMMEQFEYSTAWGSDGNTNNDSYAIKHYTAMIRYMVLEMCRDSEKFIF